MLLRRRLLVAVPVCAFGLVAAFLLWGDGEPGGRVPVVLLHGYGGQPDSLMILSDRLEAEGREVVAVALPDRATGDIEASARAVVSAMDAADTARVDMVGFSAGGVVARAAARLGGDERVRYMVLLGAPNHGARLASLAASFDASLCTGACAQLAPESSFLNELNEGDETPGRTAYTTVWSSLDQTVTPPASAELAGATNVRVQDVCPDAQTSHGELVSDPLAVGLVLRALDGHRAPPATAQCASLRALGETAFGG